MRTYRVTVRGRFDSLTDDRRAGLLAEAAEHDALRAAFTEEGTFTYDGALNAFSFRYLRSDPSPDPAVAASNAHTDAELAVIEWLEAAEIPFRDLRVESMNVDDMKASTRRLR